MGHRNVTTKRQGLIKLTGTKPVESDADFVDEDFDFIRTIINLVRRYPKSKAEFIRTELNRYHPGITDRQIARCCKFITSRWSAPTLRELAKR
uniref:Uncharacterized protein n=1 Tax=Pseudomonas phage HRDY3 TaxID=3236930 RepID=A0AB39CEW0_9VIRU